MRTTWDPEYALYVKREELAKLDAELVSVYYMSEAEVCNKYNVDYKDEAITYIEEDMDSLRDEIARLEEKQLDPDAEHERGMYHYAFPTEQNYWNYKGC
jgi:hypothetical protein